MKLPFAKDDDTKRMMSGTSNGRNELIYEAREMNVTGNSVPKHGTVNKYTQSEPTMDLGSGDTSDYTMELNNRGESYTEEKGYPNSESVVIETVAFESRARPTYERLPSSTVRFDTNKPPLSGHGDEELRRHSRLFAASMESLNEPINSTLAIVEDNHQPSFTMRESNPSIPPPTEHSKTSTLRISDRSRSEAEDDIEKADDAEQEKSIMRHDGGLKTSAKANEKIPDSEKSPKSPDWPDNHPNDGDTDCAVQCLYYMIECCECTIL